MISGAVFQRTCAVCPTQRELSQRPFPHCARCRKVFYCTQSCQKAHWREHKDHCRKPNFHPDEIATNLLRQYYSEDGLTLTFTLRNVSSNLHSSICSLDLTCEQLVLHVLLPEPGCVNFWQTYMVQHTEDHGGDDPERVYTIQLRPKNPDPAKDFGPGYSWAYTLSLKEAGNTHGTLPWNEQAAITITVRLSPSLSPPLRRFSLSVADSLLMLVNRQTPHRSLSRIEHRYTICERQSPHSAPSHRRWARNDVHVASSHHVQRLYDAMGGNGRQWAVAAVRQVLQIR
jgi:hypothetical protein